MENVKIFYSPRYYLHIKENNNGTITAARDAEFIHKINYQQTARLICSVGGIEAFKQRLITPEQAEALHAEAVAAERAKRERIRQRATQREQEQKTDADIALSYLAEQPKPIEANEKNIRALCTYIRGRIAPIFPRFNIGYMVNRYDCQRYIGVGVKFDTPVIINGQPTTKIFFGAPCDAPGGYTIIR